MEKFQREIRAAARAVRSAGARKDDATVKFAGVVHLAVEDGTRQKDIVTWSGFAQGYVSQMQLAGLKLTLLTGSKITPEDRRQLIRTAAGKPDGGDRVALKDAETTAAVLKAIYAEKAKKPGKTLAERLTVVVAAVEDQAFGDDAQPFDPELIAAVARSLDVLTRVGQAIEKGTVKVA